MERNIKLLAIFNFFTDLKFNFVILVLYFAQVTGSYTLAMSLFATVFFSSAVFEVPTGIFSDLIGRKKTIILGAVSSTLAMILYALGGNYSILFLGALAEGLSRSWYSGNNDAFLHDTLHQLGNKERFADLLGKLSTMFQIALGVSAVVGGLLAAQSFTLVMWLSVIPQTICLALSLFFVEPPQFVKESTNAFHHLKESLAIFKRNRVLQWLTIRSALNYAVGESLFHFRSAFVQMVWPTWALGFAQALSNIGAALGFWYGGLFVKRIGAGKLLIINDIYNRVVGSVANLYLTPVSPILASSTSFSYGTGQVAKGKLLHERFTNEQRATLASLNSFLGSLLYGVFAIFFGLVADVTQPNIAMFIGQLCLIPSFIIVVVLHKQKKI